MARPKNPLNTIHKTCPTCHKEFTHEKRKPKTYCSKTCAANSPEVKEKNRQGVAAAFDEKYGGHPMVVNEATKENFKSTMQEKYGTDYFPQTKEFVGKAKATKFANHGDENFNNTEQMKITCLERYGVDNYRKTKEYNEKYETTCMKKYGIAHASKGDMNSTTFRQKHKLLMFRKFYTSDKFKNFEPMFKFDEYDGITVKKNRPYRFKCTRCNKEHDYDLTRQNLRCSMCDASTSTFQLNVTEYIKQLIPCEPLVTNNRAILSPLEIDIYIPNKNLAIETNGLYWHSEISGTKNKNYHLNKTKMCLVKGIRLLHIYENEWNHQQDIVKSILKNIITRDQPIDTTKCVVKEIDADTKTAFVNNNHLDGNDAAMVRLGLFAGNDLIAIMTFLKSKFDKTGWEISRYCSKTGLTVDGQPPLFNYFVEKYKPKNVTAYVNRRYFSGESYIKIGFQIIKNTLPSYHYIIDSYDTLEKKNNWQKNKLAKKLLSFDPMLSEWENMKLNGFDRIWDCGHTKWIWIDKT